MAASTSTKVIQQLADNGMIVSMGGRAYLPMDLVADILDHVAPNASFTKADSEKLVGDYNERIEAQRQAETPVPREINPIEENDPVETEPYRVYDSPVDHNGEPIHTDAAYVIINIPVDIEPERRRSWALEKLRWTNTDFNPVLPASIPNSGPDQATVPTAIVEEEVANVVEGSVTESGQVEPETEETNSRRSRSRRPESDQESE